MCVLCAVCGCVVCSVAQLSILQDSARAREDSAAARRAELYLLKVPELKRKLESFPSLPEQLQKRLKSVKRKDDVISEIMKLEAGIQENQKIDTMFVGGQKQ